MEWIKSHYLAFFLAIKLLVLNGFIGYYIYVGTDVMEWIIHNTQDFKIIGEVGGLLVTPTIALIGFEIHKIYDFIDKERKDKEKKK